MHFCAQRIIGFIWVGFLRTVSNLGRFTFWNRLPPPLPLFFTLPLKKIILFFIFFTCWGKNSGTPFMGQGHETRSKDMYLGHFVFSFRLMKAGLYRPKLVSHKYVDNITMEKQLAFDFVSEFLVYKR